MILKGGRCKQCGTCCKYHFRGICLTETEEMRYYDEHEILKSDMLIDISDGVGNKMVQFYAIPWKCRQLTEDNHCKLHGTPEQCKTCVGWPHHDDAFYKAVSYFGGCGYYFFEIDVDTPNISAC